MMLNVLALGGVADYLHLLICVASTNRLCDLVKDAKGATSRWATAQGAPFKWRPTYAVFSVLRWDVPKIKDYILCQKAHHADGLTRPALEVSDEELKNQE